MGQECNYSLWHGFYKFLAVCFTGPIPYLNNSLYELGHSGAIQFL